MEKYNWFKLGIQVTIISLATLFFAAMLEGVMHFETGFQQSV